MKLKPGSFEPGFFIYRNSGGKLVLGDCQANVQQYFRITHLNIVEYYNSITYDTHS